MLASGMLSLPLLLLTFLFQLGHGEAAHVCDDSIHDFLVDAKEVSYVKKDFVHVGIILSGIRGATGTKKAIILKLEEMLQSMLKSSKGTRIHFIVFTDQESRPHVTGVFRQEMGRYLSETVLFDLQVVAFPTIKVECVDLEKMVERHRWEVDQMKTLFGFHYPEGTVFKTEDGHTQVPALKYTKDLFYITPLLHRELPYSLEKLIMLDIDLEFKTDILDLYTQFNQFSATQIIGLGNDLSPHYLSHANSFIKANPGTFVGSPGRYQGFNTGVALYHLGRMRESLEYNMELDVARMRELSSEKYLMQGTVGDQDWLTLLGWERPELFHLLPCSFNVQTHEGYKNAEWASVWEQYRNCTERPKIVHKNGSF